MEIPNELISEILKYIPEEDKFRSVSKFFKNEYDKNIILDFYKYQYENKDYVKNLLLNSDKQIIPKVVYNLICYPNDKLYKMEILNYLFCMYAIKRRSIPINIKKLYLPSQITDFSSFQNLNELCIRCHYKDGYLFPKSLKTLTIVIDFEPNIIIDQITENIKNLTFRLIDRTDNNILKNVDVRSLDLDFLCVIYDGPVFLKNGNLKEIDINCDLQNNYIFPLEIQKIKSYNESINDYSYLEKCVELSILKYSQTIAFPPNLKTLRILNTYFKSDIVLPRLKKLYIENIRDLSLIDDSILSNDIKIYIKNNKWIENKNTRFLINYYPKGPEDEMKEMYFEHLYNLIDY